jgi:hypothetical protein
LGRSESSFKGVDPVIVDFEKEKLIGEVPV